MPAGIDCHNAVELYLRNVTGVAETMQAAITDVVYRSPLQSLTLPVFWVIWKKTEVNNLLEQKFDCGGNLDMLLIYMYFFLKSCSLFLGVVTKKTLISDMCK